ncbi:Guanylate cyclase [Aphelenchoides fujianensis]|nr:Guanylate cyclase [Aphelenchoides fujianensis]
MPSGLSIDDDVGFRGSAGAAVVAINKAIKLGIYDPSLYNITFTWYFDQCDASLSGGYAAQMISRDQVDAIMGPVCPPSSQVVGALAAFHKVPVFTWGVAMSADFYGSQIYKTTQLMSGTVRGTMVALANVLNKFNWTSVGFVYNDAESASENIPICGSFSGVFEATAFSD